MKQTYFDVQNIIFYRVHFIKLMSFQFANAFNNQAKEAHKPEGNHDRVGNYQFCTFESAAFSRTCYLYIKMGENLECPEKKTTTTDLWVSEREFLIS